MNAERLKTILVNYISFDTEATEASYVLSQLYNCGCTDEEIAELGFDWLIEECEEEQEVE